MAYDTELDNLRRIQGCLPEEDDLLAANVVGLPLPTSTPGANTTVRLALDNGSEAFHKAMNGAPSAVAAAYGHPDIEGLAVNEAAAWRLASELGAPIKDLLTPCVLEVYDRNEGSMTPDAGGDSGSKPGGDAPLHEPAWCHPAAFFDSLIAQQDRHSGNWRWDGAKLMLIDQGYAFALPGHIINASRFVEARHSGNPQLEAGEREMLERLVASPSLLGMVYVLPRDRAEALATRAREMLARGEILAKGEY